MLPQTRTIAYFVHGHGRGHGSRALSVVPALRAQSYDVRLFASGDAIEMLAPLGALRERRLLRPGRGVLSELLTRALAERSELASLAPALVISDGDQVALLAAKLLGLPSLALGHDLVFTRCALPSQLPRRHLLQQRLNGLIPALLSTRRVAVHFLPLRSRDPHTSVARVEGEPRAADGPRIEHVVPYFRDDNGARVLALAARAGVPVAVTDSLGQPGRLSREAFRGLLQGAVGAVGSAGSNLIAECVLFATPLLALYRADDAEQALNGQLLAAADAGMACSFEQVDEAIVAQFWERARARSFRSVALAEALPSVVDAVLRRSAELLGSRDGEATCA